jgi:uncharacterized delta-60 repeat protein
VPSAGALDPSFGTGGKVTTAFVGEAVVHAIALQSDGKIVAAGAAGGDFALARYNSDGSLDTGFGTGGQVTTDFGADDSAADVALQSDGKIVVVGESVDLSRGLFQLDVARYLSNGQLDTGFGSAGTITVVNTVDGKLTLQPDGSFLVAGSTKSNSTTVESLVLIRYDSTGNLDPTFGSGGRAGIYFAATATPVVQGVAIQSDGRVVVAATGSGNVLLARFTAAGSPDASFGTDGQVSTFGATAHAFALQGDGAILVAGNAAPSGNSDFALFRYFANGSLDPTFGAGGGVVTDFGPGRQDEADAVAVQPDGRIVAAGFTRGTDDNFALARYNPNGTLDTGFGSGGLVSTDFGGTNDDATAVAIQPDGKIVAAGAAGSNFALARYLREDPLPGGNQRFVAQVYLDLLQRPADPAGLAGWSGLLGRGASRAQVVSAVLASPEYRTLQVERAYGQYLHRPADPGGLSGGVAFLTAGGTVEQLAALLAGSPEYYQNRGGGSNDGFLKALFQDGLDRSVEPAAQALFDQALANGASPTQVAAAVLGSAEYQQDLVQSAYEHALRRAADSGGLAYFTGVLRQGVPEDQILAALYGSPEYVQRL